MWRLTKVDNGNEHSMVEKNGRKYYFCEDGHSFDRKACGMYCFHKPGAEHVTWKERKEIFCHGKKDRDGECV